MLHALLQVVWTEMCVGSVCTHHPIMIQILPVFFFIYLNLYPFLKTSPSQTDTLPTIVDGQKPFNTDCTGVLPQTRPEWAVISCFTCRSRCRMTPKRLRCFVVGYNNEHSSRHLLPSSEPLKRITFGFEGNAPSIYLNVSMFARIIRDPDSSTEEVSKVFLSESLQIAFPNNVLISKFHDECG